MSHYLFRSIIFLIIVQVTTSCNRPEYEPTTQTDFKAAVEKRSSYATESETDHVDFNYYFTERSTHGVNLQTENIGTLNLTSGSVIACDPFYVGEEFTLPFEKKIKPGRYPVIICIGDFKTWGKRVAFAKLKLSEAEPVRWELAKTITRRKQPETFYGVDAGLGCFVDMETGNIFNNVLKRYYKEKPNGNYYDDILAREFKGHDNWNNHFPQKDREANIIMFSSGFGDGAYSSYWGIDSKGEIACLVTDFQLFTKNGPIFDK